MIEQAKGVLVQTLDLELSEAYERLVDQALRQGTTVTEAARRVIRDAQRT